MNENIQNQLITVILIFSQVLSSKTIKVSIILTQCQPTYLNFFFFFCFLVWLASVQKHCNVLQKLQNKDEVKQTVRRGIELKIIFSSNSGYYFQLGVRYDSRLCLSLRKLFFVIQMRINSFWSRAMWVTALFY